MYEGDIVHYQALFSQHLLSVPSPPTTISTNNHLHPPTSPSSHFRQSNIAVKAKEELRSRLQTDDDRHKHRHARHAPRHEDRGEGGDGRRTDDLRREDDVMREDDHSRRHQQRRHPHEDRHRHDDDRHHAHRRHEPDSEHNRRLGGGGQRAGLGAPRHRPEDAAALQEATAAINAFEGDGSFMQRFQKGEGGVQKGEGIGVQGEDGDGEMEGGGREAVGNGRGEDIRGDMSGGGVHGDVQMGEAEGGGGNKSVAAMLRARLTVRMVYTMDVCFCLFVSLACDGIVDQHTICVAHETCLVVDHYLYAHNLYTHACLLPTHTTHAHSTYTPTTHQQRVKHHHLLQQQPMRALRLYTCHCLINKADHYLVHLDVIQTPPLQVCV